jgi:hypothetical protein
MGYRWKTLVPGFVVMGVFIAFPFLATGARSAPKNKKRKTVPCVRKNATMIKDGLYVFQYDSFIINTADEDRFIFHRCVFNHNAKRKMFVDWKGTGVKNITNDEGVALAQIEWPTDDYEVVKTDLWYGAQPKKALTTYRKVKEAQVAKRPVKGGTLRSYARMSLPLHPLEKKSDLDRIKTVQIELKFESGVTQLPKGNYIYTYSWSDRLAPEGKGTFRLGFPLKTVGGIIKAAAKGSDLKNVLTLTNRMRGVYLTNRRQPGLKRITLQFLDNEGQEVGTSPVSVYYPKEGR